MSTQTKSLSTKQLVYGGVFVALCIVMGFQNIYLPPNGSRITFRFIPILFASVFMGPVMGSLIAFMADILTYFLTPGSPGAFFPGFTVTAMIIGVFPAYVIRGVKDVKLLNIVIITVLLFLVNWLLDSYWLSIMVGKAYKYYIAVRAYPQAVQSLIGGAVLFYLLKRFDKFMR